MDETNIQGLDLYRYCFNNPIKYVDSSGCFAISAGLIIFGMVVAFSAMVYIDYKDDGEVFNGSVTPQEYIVATALGALLGLISGLEFTITIPMLGFVNGGSAMSIGIVGTIAVSINGAQVIAGAAMAGAAYMFSKTSKLSQKETSSNKPSWVNESMVDLSKSAQENAKNILNNKYKVGSWDKGARSEYSKIVKWIERHLKYYRGK